MRLTRFSDIGLRVLIYLTGTTDRTAPVTVAEVAKQFDIPINHLVKVVGHLARAGLIEATRGRNGGIRLRADPATLMVGAVLRELEGDVDLADCVGQRCQLSGDCRLRDALRAGLAAFYACMDKSSLADIAGGDTGLHIVRMHAQFLVRAGMPVAEHTAAV